MVKSSLKINSLDGRGRRHSILRGLIPFINEICEHTPVKNVRNIGAGEIKEGFFRSLEPIEIRRFGTEGRFHFIQVRAHCNEGYQTLYLHCHKRYFPDVANYIVKYCEKRPR
jgi:hypothetical protein